ncbi:MAG TPA: hypothetical protein VF088_20695 [Pyrinomonadaceae bacterium]
MNTFRRHRVVMTTIGSLGDLHPYIALALEMKKRFIEPSLRQVKLTGNELSHSISSFIRLDQSGPSRKHLNTWK